MSSPASSATVVLTALVRLTSTWMSPRVQALVAAEAGVDIDTADIPAVHVLGDRGPMRATELADLLRLSAPTMSKQVTRLEAAGLVQRTTDASDRRARLLVLTTAGHHAYDALVARGTEMVAAALSPWTGAEVDGLADHVTRLVDALVRMETPPATVRTEERKTP